MQRRRPGSRTRPRAQSAGGRQPARRTELHGSAEYRSARVTQRDVLADLSARRQHRNVDAEWRTGTGNSRLRPEVEYRPVELRVDWQQGRCVEQRSAAVLGARSTHVGDPALSRELRQPVEIQHHRAPGQPSQTGRRAQGRTVGRWRPRCRVAYRCAGHVRPFRRCVVSPIRRRADRHRHGAVRCRDGAVATAAAKGSQGRHPYQRGWPRHHRRRRVPGAWTDRRRTDRREQNRAQAVPAGRGVRQQSGGHAGLGAGRALRTGAADRQVGPER